MEITYKQTEPEKVIPASVTEPKVIILEIDLRNNVCLITSQLENKAWQERETLDKAGEPLAQALIAHLLGKKPTVSEVKVVEAIAEKLIAEEIKP